MRYGGIVKGVTKDSITIEWPGEPPKRFLASETLAKGEFPTRERPGLNPPPGVRLPRLVVPPFRYRLTDVKVGDAVAIVYAHLGEKDICDQISILKRPGGRVPPLPDGAEAIKSATTGKDLIRYHERVNARWDWEDYNISYPAKFGKSRRFGVAPMPREVKRPAISP
jgi:hypothetical protein